MRSLRDAALAGVRTGDTTLAEVHRVLGEAESSTDRPADNDVRLANNTSPMDPRIEGAQPTDRPVEQGTPAVSDRHALVVDDETTNRVFARALLEQAGFRVTEAPDGLGALERLSAQPYDLMILDLDMPRLAGYEVLSHVRRQTSTAALPIIVLTGTSNANAEVEVIERGADDYLSKPIDARRFMARVTGVMRRATG
jgi:CheY-like chemotaxis protein